MSDKEVEEVVDAVEDALGKTEDDMKAGVAGDAAGFEDASDDIDSEAGDDDKNEQAEEKTEKKVKAARKETADLAKEKKQPATPKKKSSKDKIEKTSKSSKKSSSSSSATPAAEEGAEELFGGTTRDLGTFVPYPAGGQFFATEPDACLDIRVSKKGVGSLKPTTVMAALGKAVQKKGDLVVFRVERDGKWQETTWKQYNTQIRAAGKSFIHLGLKAHQSVNIIGFNSPEWFVANMGAIAAGGKAAGIYTTNQTEACQYITEHSEARVVVCENELQLAKFQPIHKELKNVKAFVLYTGKKSDLKIDDEDMLAKTYDWAAFMKLGAEVADEKLEKRIAAQKPGHGCTLIYTSGTTGNPKAVMITHDNLTWTPQAVFSVLGEDFGFKEEHAVSYLPLSHVAAQMLDIHMPIAVAATRPGNCTVHFARPDALKGTLKITLNAAQPTLFFGVPRVWEKMADAIKAIGAKNTGLKAKLGAWAKGKAAADYENHQVGHSGKSPFMAGLAKSLLGKVREALGLTRCRFQMTGAAPIGIETLKYFGSLNLGIDQLYGLSETTGPHTISSPKHYLVGACGPALPGCEMKLDHVPSRDKKGEGEICMRGRHIMMGYMKNEKKTREAIDPKGWFHSGDVGRIDSFGYLWITGRIKELIITAGGENVAPVPVEDMIKFACPAISNVMMVGDKRKFNVILVTLKTEPNEDGSFSDKLDATALAVDSKCKTVADAVKSEKWKAYIQKGMKEANDNAVSNASKVQYYRIAPIDFSVPTGELTSTLKLKRSVVEAKYKEMIDDMYSGATKKK